MTEMSGSFTQEEDHSVVRSFERRRSDSSSVPSIDPSNDVQDDVNLPSLKGFTEMSSSRLASSSFSHGGTSDKRRNIARWITKSIIRNDYAAAVPVLQFLPLRFRSPIDEKEFFYHLIPGHIVRAFLISAIVLLTVVIIWIAFTVGFSYNLYPVSNDIALYTLHGSMALISLSMVAYWRASQKNWFKPYIEAGNYVIVIVYTNLYLSWILYNILTFPIKNPLDILSLDQFKLWTNPLTLGLILWTYVSMNLVMRARTRKSFFPQLFNLILNSSLTIIVAIYLGEKHKSGGVEIHHHDIFYRCVAGLEVASMGCVFMVAYFGRWTLELQERIEYWKYTKSATQLKSLRVEQKKKKTKSGSTAVEDLLNIITRATTRIQESEIITGNKTLVESTEILRQIQEILTNTDNLYAVKLQSDSGEIPSGDANLEAQFYEIYVTKPLPAGGPCRQLTRQKSQVEDIEAGHGVVQISHNVRNLAPTLKATADFRRAVGREWNCNMLKAAQEYHHIAVEVAALLLEPRSQDLDVSPISIRNFAYRIERLYRANPYHNSCHAAMVAHSTSCLLRMLEIHEASDYFSPLDYTATIIAALGHDAGHPGRNNNFYVGIFDRLALFYNDRSVLENFHTALVFKSMEPNSCNVFASLNYDISKDLRRKIIELILATDMGQHFESVSKFRLRRQAMGFNFLADSDDMWLVIRMCIKCADLSHALVDWNQHQEWSLRVAEEFYQQGNEEAALGVPKSPLCDRAQHIDFAKSQKGFIEFVVQPLFSQMDDMDIRERIAENCLKHLTYNKYKWEEMTRERKTLDIPEEVQSKLTDSTAYQLLLLHLIVPPRYKLQPIIEEDNTEALRLRGGTGGRRRRMTFLSSKTQGGADKKLIEEKEEEEEEKEEDEEEGYEGDEYYEEINEISEDKWLEEGVEEEQQEYDYEEGEEEEEDDEKEENDEEEEEETKADLRSKKRAGTNETARFGEESFEQWYNSSNMDDSSKKSFSSRSSDENRYQYKKGSIDSEFWEEDNNFVLHQPTAAKAEYIITQQSKSVLKAPLLSDIDFAKRLESPII